MEIGVITMDGLPIGVVNFSREIDEFAPDYGGYEPAGRADESMGPTGRGSGIDRGPGRGGHHLPTHAAPSQHSGPVRHHAPKGGTQGKHYEEPWQVPFPAADGKHRAAPAGRSYEAEQRGAPFRQGSADTDAAIRAAAEYAGEDVNSFRAIASIESSMNPSSNYNRGTQYKGLYQIGSDEWRRTGAGGNIYSARDNAMAMARLVRENKAQFARRFGRNPTETEVYLMHQQGLGFYTRGITTNLRGNQPPGGSHDAASHEAGWGRELARRKAGFERANPKPVADKPFDPETQPL